LSELVDCRVCRDLPRTLRLELVSVVSLRLKTGSLRIAVAEPLLALADCLVRRLLVSEQRRCLVSASVGLFRLRNLAQTNEVETVKLLDCWVVAAMQTLIARVG
jgi:hypothetical protein